MQDAQDDRNQICLNNVTKGSNAYLNATVSQPLYPLFLQYGPCEDILMIISYLMSFYSDVIMTLVFSNDLRLR